MPDFTGNCDKSRCRLLAPTTALLDPENYGLRGGISAPHDPAWTPSIGVFSGCLAGADGRMGVMHLRAEGRNAGLIFEGSAGGMKMSKGRIGRWMLGLAVSCGALVAG